LIGLLGNKIFVFKVLKRKVSPNGEPITFLNRVSMAAVAGATGGFIGTPGDMINVRMQNDIKLPTEQRRK
jgi:dicarboxylate transporter 10